MAVEGLKMITIQILINGVPIETINAYRQQKFTVKSRVYTYRCGGKKIKHKFSDGAKKLAIKMLKI